MRENRGLYWPMAFVITTALCVACIILLFGSAGAIEMLGDILTGGALLLVAVLWIRQAP